MGKISVLKPEIVQIIAAGEVVERPASVLKELIENSLDAGATKISIRLEEGGKDLIEVSDNGEGLAPADALLAFSMHATSKLATAEDLESLLSYGFRGEALASVSGVSTVELQTYNGSEASGVVATAGQAAEVTPKLYSQGTTITVRNLFSNVPARAKFLKTTATELQQCIDTFLGLSLSRLFVSWELFHGDKLLYRLPAVTDFQTRAYDIWGDVAKQLYLGTTQHGDTKINIWLGNPDIARKDRKQQFVLVNGRVVSDRTVQKAILEGYRGFIHRDLQPVYFAFIDLPANAVDVNVHPRKQEVRFKDGGFIFGSVFKLVQQTLAAQTKASLIERIQGASPVNAPQTPSFLLNEVSSSYNARTPTSTASAAGSGGLKQQRIQQSLELTQSLLNSSTTNNNSDNQFEAGPLQVFHTYIVYARGNSLYFVDQHAAAEKILYEKLRKQLGNTPAQSLLVPEIVELEPETKALTIANQTRLAELGISLSDFGGNSIQLTARPAALPNFDIGGFLTEFFASHQPAIESLDTNASNAQDDSDWEVTNPALHHVLATMACHGSIRAGQSLQAAEMKQLLQDLVACDYPYNCPHGRPVSWVLPRTDLEKNFKRVI